MKVESFTDGHVILGTFPDPEVLRTVRELAPSGIPLTIADPPYGNIVSDDWDQVEASDDAFASTMVGWTLQIGLLSVPGAALYMWGGIGVPGFRPFYKYAGEVEDASEFAIANHITWGKKRAYGVSHNYLFTREEALYLVKGDPKKPRCFNIPLLEEKRGYEGYSKKYPAKSEFKRRTNVWTDITEILRGKKHVAQKPDRLYEIIVETSSRPGDVVFDPFAGSGTAARAARAKGRRFILVEQDPESFEIILASLR